MDGKVHFRSARKGTPLSEPLQMTELIDGILITEKWGFIMMHSMRTLYLYSINRAKIKEVKLAAPIVTWTTFPSVFGFDYVAYANDHADIVLFEAFYPERAQIISRHWNVIALAAEPTSDRLVIVMANGYIHGVPYSFGQPTSPVPFAYDFK
jgi:hypothetical protein